ncbi:MAG: hypothetical protein JXL84_25750 [Deltaproteobacteria bacterium]|nr:hypothetical protein [Deltaproteobacteria bacterium]
MKKRILALGVIVLFALLAPWPVSAREYTEVFHSGKIDWLHGVAETTVTTMLSAKHLRSDRARAKAANEALESARQSLLDLVGRIKIDSRTSIKDLLSRAETLRDRLQELVRNLPVQGIHYRGKGRVDLSLAIPLSGALSELVLPQDIRTIDSVYQPRIPTQATDQEFTGLVVDCPGVSARPAMVPKIFDEDGQLVYGAPYISREYAVKLGVAGYFRDVQAAQSDERVGPKPLTVKGIKTAATGPSDLTISNSDAARIRGTASNLKWLQRCKVLIVLE